MSISDTLSEEQSLTAMEEDRSRTNGEGEGTSLTETDDLEAMLSGPQPVLTEALLVETRPTPMLNVFYHALGQGLEVLGDVQVGGNSRYD